MIVRASEYADLRALATRSPWKEMKTAAISVSNGTTFSVGGTSTLGVTATGDVLTYQCFRDGVAIAGATATTYTRTDAAPSDAGASTVRISNSSGTVTSASAAVSVTVVAAAPVTRGAAPKDRLVVANATFTFEAPVSGDGPSCQWVREGSAIAGATGATYAAPSTAPGAYTVQTTGPTDGEAIAEIYKAP